jgi:hypothetical protein
MDWLIVFLIIIGDLLIILKKSAGFLIWLFCDAYLCNSFFMKQDFSTAAVFGLYSLVGVAGYLKWKKEEI